MKNLLKEFEESLIETNTFPKDELNDYYLLKAQNLLINNPEIYTLVENDTTALMLVTESIVKPNVHPIRGSQLCIMALNIIEKTVSTVLNYQNSNGDSVVHISLNQECFSVGVWDCMKEKNANFSLPNKKGVTPLMLAAKEESLDDLKCIHAYSSINVLDYRDIENGYTALRYAINSMKINNIFYLLESGASLFIKDNESNTVIDTIKSKCYKSKAPIKYYQELYKIIDLFKQKQLAEISLKIISKR
jgi:hypothetical protein